MGATPNLPVRKTAHITEDQDNKVEQFRRDNDLGSWNAALRKMIDDFKVKIK